MNQAIGVIEFVSIARGMDTTDRMLKVAQVQLLKSCTCCPGKYLTIIGGNSESVKYAMKEGEYYGGEYVVEIHEIHNVHGQLIPAMLQTNPIEEPQAIGIMEFYSVTSGIAAADAAAKAANVSLIEVRLGYAVGGKGLVLLTGDLEAVKTAVQVALEQEGYRLQTAVIARPEQSLLESLL